MVAFLFLAVDMSVRYNFLEGKVNCVVWERMHVRFFFFKWRIMYLKCHLPCYNGKVISLVQDKHAVWLLYIIF